MPFVSKKGIKYMRANFKASNISKLFKECWRAYIEPTGNAAGMTYESSRDALEYQKINGNGYSLIASGAMTNGIATGKP
jgi:hypothetical protein